MIHASSRAERPAKAKTGTRVSARHLREKGRTTKTQRHEEGTRREPQRHRGAQRRNAEAQRRRDAEGVWEVHLRRRSNRQSHDRQLPVVRTAAQEASFHRNHPAHRPTLPWSAGSVSHWPVYLTGCLLRTANRGVPPCLSQPADGSGCGRGRAAAPQARRGAGKGAVRNACVRSGLFRVPSKRSSDREAPGRFITSGPPSASLRLCVSALSSG